jgi:hypothetical protein
LRTLVELASAIVIVIADKMPAGATPGVDRLAGVRLMLSS